MVAMRLYRNALIKVIYYRFCCLSVNGITDTSHLCDSQRKINSFQNIQLMPFQNVSISSTTSNALNSFFFKNIKKSIWISSILSETISVYFVVRSEVSHNYVNCFSQITHEVSHRPNWAFESGAATVIDFVIETAMSTLNGWMEMQRNPMEPERER